MLAGFSQQPVGGHCLRVGAHMFATVAFEQAFDSKEQIGPDRLRAEIAAPYAAGDGVHQEQADRGEDQQAGEVIDFLRPQLDEEEIEPAVAEIDQHCLRRRVRSAIPPHEGQQIIDTQRNGEHDPFDAAKAAGDALRINFAPRRIERDVVLGLRHKRRRRHQFGLRLFHEFFEGRHARFSPSGRVWRKP